MQFYSLVDFTLRKERCVSGPAAAGVPAAEILPQLKRGSEHWGLLRGAPG